MNKGAGKFDSVTMGPSAGVRETLGLLAAVESAENLTQRSLAGRLGIALGLANALVRRAVRKGFVKIADAPARRYGYYLTPKGFGEKSRLVAEYLSCSLGFFRQARAEYGALFAYCRNRGWTRVALAGSGELAEIALLSAQEHDVSLVGVLDPALKDVAFCGLPVIRAPGAADAVVLTDAAAPQVTFERLRAALPADRILAPPLLHVSRTVPVLAEEG